MEALVAVFLVFYTIGIFVCYGTRMNRRYDGSEGHIQSFGWALIWPRDLWIWLNKDNSKTGRIE